jgi:hypothetical protein
MRTYISICNTCVQEMKKIEKKGKDVIKKTKGGGTIPTNQIDE